MTGRGKRSPLDGGSAPYGSPAASAGGPRSAWRALAKLGPNVAVVGAFAVVAVAFGAVATPVCPAGFDCESYLAIASDPRAAPSLPPHHAGRILPPLVAHAIHRLGVRELGAFRGLAVLGYFAIATATFLALRRDGPVVPAAAVTLWLWLVPEPFLYCLLDVAQAGYLWTFAAVVAMDVLRRTGRPRAALVVGMAASLCRQELLIATVLVSSGQARRRVRDAAMLAAALAIFWAMEHVVAPASAGVLATAWHALSLGAISAVWSDPATTALVWMFLPFAVAAAPLGAPLWVRLYALIVLTLETCLAGLAGTGNFARLALLGLWPMAWQAGASVVRIRAPAWTWTTGVALALIFVASRRLVPTLGIPRSIANAYAVLAPITFFVGWMIGIRMCSRRTRPDAR